MGFTLQTRHELYTTLITDIINHTSCLTHTPTHSYTHKAHRYTQFVIHEAGSDILKGAVCNSLQRSGQMLAWIRSLFQACQWATVGSCAGHVAPLLKCMLQSFAFRRLWCFWGYYSGQWMWCRSVFRQNRWSIRLTCRVNEAELMAVQWWRHGPRLGEGCCRCGSRLYNFSQYSIYARHAQNVIQSIWLIWRRCELSRNRALRLDCPSQLPYRRVSGHIKDSSYGEETQTDFVLQQFTQAILWVVYWAFANKSWPFYHIVCL